MTAPATAWRVALWLALCIALAGCADLDPSIHRVAELAMGEDDPDGDGLVTSLESAFGLDPASADSDRDGLDDGLEFGDDDTPRDSDDDGLVDALDDDSDGDRIADRDEARDRGDPSLVADTDGDGVIDALDDDSDGDRIADRDEAGDDDVDTPPIDTDRDGTPDAFDIDSDDDTIPDKIEAGDDDPATPPRDSDRDGTPDCRDSDSDDGGTSDRRERALGTDPIDPTDDAARDGDGDGVDDDLEERLGMDPTLADSDGDTIDDADELGRVSDGVRDTDDDGVIDALDDDSDGDSIPDRIEAGDDDLDTPPFDTDGDGVPDARDLDSDGGGVPDAIEAEVHGTDPTQIDDDGVGWFVDTDIDAGSYCATAGATAGAGTWLAIALGYTLARRRRRRRARRCERTATAAVVTVVLALAPSTGTGQTNEHPDARETGLTLLRDPIDPAGGPMASGDAVPLAPGSVRITLQLQSLHNPVVARDDDTGDLVDRVVAWRRELDFAIAFGVAPRADLSIIAPVVIGQQARNPGAGLPDVRRSGFADVIVTPRVRLTGRRHSDASGGIAIRVPVSLPTGGANAWMGHRGLSARPELVLSLASDGVVLAGSAGVLVQPRVTIDDLVADDTITGAVALRYLAWRGWSADLAWRVERRLASAPRPDDAVRGHVSMAVFKGWTHPVGILFGGAIGHGGMAPNPSLRGFVGVAIQLDREPRGEANGANDADPDSSPIDASDAPPDLATPDEPAPVFAPVDPAPLPDH